MSFENYKYNEKLAYLAPKLHVLSAMLSIGVIPLLSGFFEQIQNILTPIVTVAILIGIEAFVMVLLYSLDKRREIDKKVGLRKSNIRAIIELRTRVTDDMAEYLLNEYENTLTPRQKYFNQIKLNQRIYAKQQINLYLESIEESYTNSS